MNAEPETDVVSISFNLAINGIINTDFVSIMPIAFAKEIVDHLVDQQDGGVEETAPTHQPEAAPPQAVESSVPQPAPAPSVSAPMQQPQPEMTPPMQPAYPPQQPGYPQQPEYATTAQHAAAGISASAIWSTAATGTRAGWRAAP